ncbi:MAG: hypothetical protein GX654_14180 [Desulfatiglans sp.]|nr:hypothetical protein [Desulfatiglans sp.]
MDNGVPSFILCPGCNKGIRDNLHICPICGYELTLHEILAFKTDSRLTGRGDTAVLIGCSSIIIIVLAFIVISFYQVFSEISLALSLIMILFGIGIVVVVVHSCVTKNQENTFTQKREETAMESEKQTQGNGFSAPTSNEVEKRLQEQALKPDVKLIPCPDCGKDVSRRAISCPSCGCPITQVGTTISPKCPTCGSSDIEKISLKNKVGSAALIGVFAIGHISKTFKCNSCGSKW